MIGVYFDQGPLGVLYAPLLRDEPERYPRMPRAQFIELVRERHGVSLEGLGLS
jgi:hypothetical protein